MSSFNRSNTPSFLKTGGLAGGFENDSTYKALKSKRSQTTESLPDEYSARMKPSKLEAPLPTRGTQDQEYWHDPLEFGPNYKHNVASGGRHFKKGGYADGGSPEIGDLTGALHAMGDAIHAATGMWIQHAVKKPGALHKALHVPKGKKIPLETLEKATHSKSPKMRKRANFALTVKGFHKG